MAILTAARRGRSPRTLVARLLLAALPLVGAAPAGALPAPEYQVKATFLFHFASFVDWPPAAFADAASPLVIGVLGEDVFGPYLEEAIRDERIDGRPLAVERYRRVEDIIVCHVLFISPSESAKLGDILAALAGRSILTVGESEGFASRGGMVRFVLEERKVRLRINRSAAQAAGLSLSSKLLRLADIVRPGD